MQAGEQPLSSNSHCKKEFSPFKGFLRRLRYTSHMLKQNGGEYMKRKIILTAVAITVLGAGTLAASTAFAQNDTTNKDHMSPLVQKISDKFGLNKDEVQAVVDEHHTQRKAQMHARFEEKLTQAVKDGKITETQKQAIITKFKELKEHKSVGKESLRSMTPEQRKAAFEKKHQELKEWAQANDIDLQYLIPHGGKGMGFKAHVW